jgi:hypothetical protein
MDRCFAVRCPLSAVRYPLSAVLRSQLPAPSQKLQATGYGLQATGYRIKFVDKLHFVFKYMRATAHQPRPHASQNKIHTHKY